MRNIPELVTGAALLVCWSVLLGSRYIAAAFLMSGKNCQDSALGFRASCEVLGWLLPVCAWLAFAAACFMLARAWFGCREVKL